MKNQGFIGTIFFIIVGLALLKYFFDWSIFDAVESEQGRSTIVYIRDILNTVWSYLATPITFLMNKLLTG